MTKKTLRYTPNPFYLKRSGQFLTRLRNNISSRRQYLFFFNISLFSRFCSNHRYHFRREFVVPVARADSFPLFEGGPRGTRHGLFSVSPPTWSEVCALRTRTPRTWACVRARVPSGGSLLDAEFATRLPSLPCCFRGNFYPLCFAVINRSKREPRHSPARFSQISLSLLFVENRCNYP